MLIRCYGCFRRFLGVTCDFLDRGGHFVHRGGHLIGLDLLAVHPGAGLLRYRRQLFRRAGDLRHAVANPADQLAQVNGHALDAGLQLTHFVATVDDQVVAQVAIGNALHDIQGLQQRSDDLAGNNPGGNDAEHQCQHGSDGQHGFGLLAVGLTFAVLIVRQFLGCAQ